MQVWFEDRCVGHMNTPWNGGEIVSLAVMDGLGGDIRKIDILVKTRSLMISRTDMELGRENGEDKLIRICGGSKPEHLDVYKDHQDDALIYKWPVLAPTREQFEEIFDLDQFQPA
jgi:hypothetical protein